MYLIANWKMYLSQKDALKLAKQVAATDISSSVDFVLCPSATAIAAVGEIVKKKVALGGQDAFWGEEGAYTGEISCKRLKELGCRYVILGHSERRQYAGETNDVVYKKLMAARRSGLTPILCVGESKKERESGGAVAAITRQLTEALEGISIGEREKLIVAYEPVWAIGTGDACTPQDAARMKDEMKRIMNTKRRGGACPVLYGGSVDESNVVEYTTSGGFDGVLVGGASTKIKSLQGMMEQLS